MDLEVAQQIGRTYRPKPRDEIARNMSAIRSTENKTERALRSILHRRGLRFRKYVKSLPGNPDLVFPGARVAVFVDGDYWHGRILQELGEQAFVESLRNVNREYWIAKLKRNASRDAAATEALESRGWRVIRIWESDAKKNLAASADRVERAVRKPLGATGGPARGRKLRGSDKQAH